MKKPVTLLLIAIILIMTIAHFAFQSYVKNSLTETLKEFLKGDSVGKVDVNFQKLKVKPFKKAGTVEDLKISNDVMSATAESLEFDLSNGDYSVKEIKGNVSFFPVSIENYQINNFKTINGLPINSKSFTKNMVITIPSKKIQFLFDNGKVILNSDTEYTADLDNKTVDAAFTSMKVNNLFDMTMEIGLNNVELDKIAALSKLEKNNPNIYKNSDEVLKMSFRKLNITFRNIDLINKVYAFMNSENSKTSPEKVITELKREISRFERKGELEQKKLAEAFLAVFEKKANFVKIETVFKKSITFKEFSSKAGKQLFKDNVTFNVTTE